MKRVSDMAKLKSKLKNKEKALNSRFVNIQMFLQKGVILYG